MKLKKFLSLLFILNKMPDEKSACERYKRLKVNDFPSIDQDDLPNEFSMDAFGTVDEFIKKTVNLDFECLLYFDYQTGEILDCAIGDSNGVTIDFDEEQFEKHHVASIHNHTKDVFSPPSGKNFGILMREFEDFELIAGVNELWILKANGVDMGLNMELKVFADLLLDSCQDFCRKRYDDNKADDVCDIMYGILLSNYINDKNINHIQLTKRSLNHGY